MLSRKDTSEILADIIAFSIANSNNKRCKQGVFLSILIIEIMKLLCQISDIPEDFWLKTD